MSSLAQRTSICNSASTHHKPGSRRALLSASLYDNLVMAVNIRSLRDPFQRLFLRYLLYIALRPGAWREARAFTTNAYQVVLGRSPTQEEVAEWVSHIQHQKRARTSLVWALLTSPEFIRLNLHRNLPINTAVVAETLHATRCQLVQSELPPAAEIVDLGGACSWSLEGALLAMGYPHHPQRITIIDLPPNRRMFAETFRYVADERDQWSEVRLGVLVRYLHRSFVNLDTLPDASVDLVWSGETIEHVTRDEARQTAREVWRVLKPGGFFCLDTPNRAITRLQFPHGLIHPEHRYEYEPRELAEQLRQDGFQVCRMLGICPMPRSAQTGRFDLREIFANPILSPDADQSYLFYLEARKPA